MRGGRGPPQSFAASAKKVVPNDGCRSMESMIVQPGEPSVISASLRISRRQSVGAGARTFRAPRQPARESASALPRLHDPQRSILSPPTQSDEPESKVSLGSDELNLWNEVEASWQKLKSFVHSVT